MTSSLVYPLFKLTSFPTGSLYYFSLPSVLTCSTGPHMENRLFFFWEVFFFLEDRDKIHSTPRCSLTVPACAVCFQMNSWENMVAFWPAYIPVPPPLTAATAILPSRSIISILSFTLFLFLFFWLALWTKHGARWHCKACLLPSQVLSVCSSVPLRAP